jgi:hypothetical protein
MALFFQKKKSMSGFSLGGVWFVLSLAETPEQFLPRRLVA